MKTKFLDSCYKVSALSTCILNKEPNPDYLYGATSQVQITDNLTAITKYEPLLSDYISPYDYEFHVFSIDFIRNGEFLHGFAYERKINKKLNGSLANPELPLEVKLDTLKTLNPGLRGKLQSLTTTSILTPEEEKALIAKGTELQEEAERKLELETCLSESKQPQEEKSHQKQKTS